MRSLGHTTLQVLLSAVIVLTAQWRELSAMHGLGLLLGIGISVMSVTQMRHALSMLPDVPERASLITSGMYQNVRHPMYLGLLIAMGTLALLPPALPRVLLWLALLGTLRAKARREEDLLAHRFPAYSEYRKRSGRFLPKLSLPKTKFP